MSKQSYSKSKRRSGNERFVMLTLELIESPAWQDLSLRARDLFVRLTAKYNGKNNGDLSLTLSELKAEGELRSPASLRKAFDELWSHGFIVLTREGSFGSQRVCNLWGLTTFPVDENRKKGIQGTGYASNQWWYWRRGEDAPDYRNKIKKVQAKRHLCKN